MDALEIGKGRRRTVRFAIRDDGRGPRGPEAGQEAQPPHGVVGHVDLDITQGTGGGGGPLRALQVADDERHQERDRKHDIDHAPGGLLARVNGTTRPR